MANLMLAEETESDQNYASLAIKHGRHAWHTHSVLQFEISDLTYSL